MRSMTGYGKGEYKENGVEVVCEIKTVNNRYLDVSLKCPRALSAVEEEIRSLIRDSLTRGHADVYFSLKDKRETSVSFTPDLSIVKGYKTAVEEIKTACPDLIDDFTLSSLLRLPDVLQKEDGVELDETLRLGVFTALQNALTSLNQMREKEGEKLKADMLSRMETIESLVREIKERAPLVAQEYAKKMRARIEEVLGGVAPDESRLLTEVALFTDKSNIDEELTRLFSHISQFRSIAEEGLVGRKLDFLVQEFNREANTTCSKSNDLDITRAGLALKNEIEKVREQVQNLE